MTWHFYALQQLSDRLSREDDGEDSLGVAAFRLGDHPASGTFSLRLLERDQELSESSGESGGGGARQTSSEREDDLLGTVSCSVEAGRPTFAAEVEGQTGGSSDPTVTIVVLLEGETEPPADQRRWTVPVPRSARADDDDPWLEFGLLAEGQDWGDQAPVRLRAQGGTRITWWTPPEPPPGATEWDKRAVPQEGQTIDGYTIGANKRVQVSANARITLRTSNADHPDQWGIYYGGRNAFSSLIDAAVAAAGEYRAQGHYYKALAAEGLRYLREGGTSAVNTYDNQFITLGMGWGSSKTTELIAAHQGPAGDRLREVLRGMACYQDGSTWNIASFNPRSSPQWDAAARRIRLDVARLGRFIQLSEHRYFCYDAARANLVTYVEKDAVAQSTADELRWANQQAQQAEPGEQGVLMTIAAYLHHGRPAWITHPVNEVKAVLDAGEIARQAGIIGITPEQLSTPSARLALLLKRHAEQCWLRDNQAAAKLITRSLGRKIEIFANAQVERLGAEAGAFSVEEAQRVIPCFRGQTTDAHGHATWIGAGVWRGETSAPAGTRVVVRNDGRHYDFGPPVLLGNDPNRPSPAEEPEPEDEDDADADGEAEDDA